ncbi:MAG: hypothetical protein ACK521_04075 [bacterium]
MAYFVIILCGTLGAPRSIASHTIQCGQDFNSCSLKSTLNNSMQICVMHSNIEVGEQEFIFLSL